MSIDRRSFLKDAAAACASVISHAAPRPMKITRVRFYESPLSRPMFNQSFHVVTIETDAGITGVGEGGSRDTIQECAEMLIGEDATRIDHCWQLMMRGRFYPAGREKLDALGALDMALWDLKGKALGVPVYQLLGGQAREYVECYSTAFPARGDLKETARACIEAGFRAYRTSVADPAPGEPFDVKRMVRKTYDDCAAIHDAVGPNGDWAIDYHTRLDFPDAVRLSTLIEPLEPFFTEDLVRSENPGVYRQLREHVKVPIAVGEQYGSRWDISELIENQLIDFSRVTLPNCGGITEYMKIAALCETHSVGLIPHFTGPIAESALVHCCAVFSGPVLMEWLGEGKKDIPYLPQWADFRNGKLWPNDRPGLGVQFDAGRLPLTLEVTKRSQPIPTFHRPDGSLTNW
ncbi:MAG TPA: mandelate racemase/muconate lactonizing enzyme family protein [Bryobacteraceae bacterium]|nr:mandelate racemase/muconate lactonizing enzyme family protein [Bryobacteraceae bacterium]